MNANNTATITGGIAVNPRNNGKSEDKPVVSTLIIANDGYYDRDGNWVEQSSAIPVTLFGGAAKRALKDGLKKGDTYTLVGKMQSGSYEKDGSTIRTMELQLSDPAMIQRRAKAKPKQEDAA